MGMGAIKKTALCVTCFFVFFVDPTVLVLEYKTDWQNVGSQPFSFSFSSWTPGIEKNDSIVMVMRERVSRIRCMKSTGVSE